MTTFSGGRGTITATGWAVDRDADHDAGHGPCPDGQPVAAHHGAEEPGPQRRAGDQDHRGLQPDCGGPTRKARGLPLRREHRCGRNRRPWLRLEADPQGRVRESACPRPSRPGQAAQSPTNRGRSGHRSGRRGPLCRNRRCRPQTHERPGSPPGETPDVHPVESPWYLCAGGFVRAGFGVHPAPALRPGTLPAASSPVTVPTRPTSASRSTGRDGFGPRRRCTFAG